MSGELSRRIDQDCRIGSHTLTGIVDPVSFKCSHTIKKPAVEYRQRVQVLIAPDYSGGRFTDTNMNFNTPVLRTALSGCITADRAGLAQTGNVDD